MPTKTFADKYETLPLATILHAYEAGPARVNAAIEGLSIHDLCATPRPGKWSIQEVLAHVADAEVVNTARIRMTLATPGTLLVAYDQDTFARKFEYGRMTAEQIEDQLGLFATLRRTTLPTLARLRPEEWASEGVHEERGPLSVRNIVDLSADHSERHLGQILEMRRLLGKPIAMELLLQERLY